MHLRATPAPPRARRVRPAQARVSCSLASCNRRSLPHAPPCGPDGCATACGRRNWTIASTLGWWSTVRQGSADDPVPRRWSAGFDSASSAKPALGLTSSTLHLSAPGRRTSRLEPVMSGTEGSAVSHGGRIKCSRHRGSGDESTIHLHRRGITGVHSRRAYHLRREREPIVQREGGSRRSRAVLVFLAAHSPCHLRRLVDHRCRWLWRQR
jgi:hypothetical protein